jgi:glycogen debranching enzyme
MPTGTALSSTPAAPIEGCATRDGRTPGTASTSPTVVSLSHPIALCEVQGYVYAALLSRASIERQLGDHEHADTLARRAAALKSAFNERFWLEDRGWFAVGLDPIKHRSMP